MISLILYAWICITMNLVVHQSYAGSLLNDYIKSKKLNNNFQLNLNKLL